MLTGSPKNTLASINDCAIYNSGVGVKLLRQIHDVHLRNLLIGDGVQEPIATEDMEYGSYYRRGEEVAPEYQQALHFGLITDSSNREFTNGASSAEEDAEITSAVANQHEPWRSILPTGPWRNVAAILIVIFMPVFGFAIYIIMSGRRKIVGKVLAEALQRMFTR